MGVAALRSVPAQTCGSETEWDWEKSFHQCREPSCRLGGVSRQSLSCWWLKMEDLFISITLLCCGSETVQSSPSSGASSFLQGIQSCWLFWDLVKPRPSKEPAPASGATHSIFAMSWHCFSARWQWTGSVPWVTGSPCLGRTVWEVCAAALERAVSSPVPLCPLSTSLLLGLFPAGFEKEERKELTELELL